MIKSQNFKEESSTINRIERRTRERRGTRRYHTLLFCKQPSFGNMISCDNESSCPNGEWFHYKCVGILNRVVH